MKLLRIILFPLRVILITLILVLKIIFELLPSILYGITPYFFMPIGYMSGYFMKRPSPSKRLIITLKFTTAFLIVIMPVILYLYVWKPLGFIFFAWIVIYFIIRFYSGAHEKERSIRHGAMGLNMLIEKHQLYYVENKPIIAVIVIVLTITSLLIGYLISGVNGLWVGSIIAFIIVILGQHQYKAKPRNDG